MMGQITEAVLLVSGARTSTQTIEPLFNPDSLGDITGIEIVLDLTAFTTAASLTLSIEEWNQGAGAYRTVLAATALAAVGVKRLLITPISPTAANASLSGLVGNQFRVVVTHGNANSHTYSVTAKYLRGVI